MIVLVVAVFLFTFVIPIAQDQAEGFVDGSGSGSNKPQGPSKPNSPGPSKPNSPAPSISPPFVSGPYSTNKKIN